MTPIMAPTRSMRPRRQPGGYDAARGAAVVAKVREFLDATIPGWEAALTGGECPHAYATRDGGILFMNNGLHIELVIDPKHPVGKTDPLGIADVVLESALTTIADLEDSVAAVDAEDKLAAYANWLGVIRGDLTDTFEKGGKSAHPRAVAGPGMDRAFGQHIHPAGPQPAVRAQCRPPDDQPGDPAGRWQRDSRRHHGCGADQRHFRPRCEGPRQVSQFAHRQHLHRQAQDARARGMRLHQHPVRCGGRPARPGAPHGESRRDG